MRLPVVFGACRGRLIAKNRGAWHAGDYSPRRRYAGRPSLLLRSKEGWG
jgi:hypothetical protein